MTESNINRLIIDRFEDEGWAVVEGDGRAMDIPAVWLPESAAEGDTLRLQIVQEGDSSHVAFAIDRADTEARAERIRSKLDQLRGR